MFRLPDAPTDERKLSDWLELTAVSSPDSNVSAGDLQSALKAASLFDDGGEEALDLKTLDVFAEIESRSIAGGEGYPFDVAGPVLHARAGWEASSYVFCLCLSYMSWKQPSHRGIYPSRLFESLSVEAARRFVNGNAVGFGFPRAGLPKGFSDAVNALCQSHIREGDGFRAQPSAWNKDGGLDVVAWRDLDDGLPGKLILFGACAAGADWQEKINELQPGNFCDQWMIQKPVSTIVKAFFVPHRVRRDRWEKTSRSAGIIFDRCRIASVVASVDDGGVQNADLWVRAVLDEATL